MCYNEFKTILMGELSNQAKERNWSAILIEDGGPPEAAMLEANGCLSVQYPLDFEYRKYQSGCYSLKRDAKAVLDYMEQQPYLPDNKIEHMENVMIWAINYENGREILEEREIPYFKIGDMAAFFKFRYDSMSGSYGRSVLKRDLTRWGLSEYELFQKVKYKEPGEIEAGARFLEETPGGFGNPLVTTAAAFLDRRPHEVAGENGVGVIFYPKVIEQFKMAFGENVLIVPVSTQTAILCPESQIREVWVRKQIQEFAEHTDSRSVLSNSIYICREGMLERFGTFDIEKEKVRTRKEAR